MSLSANSWDQKNTPKYLSVANLKVPRTRSTYSTSTSRIRNEGSSGKVQNTPEVRSVRNTNVSGELRQFKCVLCLAVFIAGLYLLYVYIDSKDVSISEPSDFEVKSIPHYYTKLENVGVEERDVFQGFRTSFLPHEELVLARRSADPKKGYYEGNITSDIFIWDSSNKEDRAPTRVKRTSQFHFTSQDYPDERSHHKRKYVGEEVIEDQDAPEETDEEYDSSESNEQYDDDEDLGRVFRPEQHVDRGPLDDVVEQVRGQPELEEGELGSSAYLYKPGTQNTNAIHSFWKGQGDMETIRTQADIMKKYMDAQADPCHDFYQYACGNWASLNPIPADKAGYDTFEMLRENLDTVLKELLEFKENEQIKSEYPGDNLDLRDLSLNVLRVQPKRVTSSLFPTDYETVGQGDKATSPDGTEYYEDKTRSSYDPNYATVSNVGKLTPTTINIEELLHPETIGDINIDTTTNINDLAPDSDHKSTQNLEEQYSPQYSQSTNITLDFIPSKSSKPTLYSTDLENLTNSLGLIKPTKVNDNLQRMHLNDTNHDKSELIYRIRRYLERKLKSAPSSKESNVVYKIHEYFFNNKHSRAKRIPKRYRPISKNKYKFIAPNTYSKRGLYKKTAQKLGYPHDKRKGRIGRKLLIDSKIAKRYQKRHVQRSSDCFHKRPEANKQIQRFFTTRGVTKILHPIKELKNYKDNINSLFQTHANRYNIKLAELMNKTYSKFKTKMNKDNLVDKNPMDGDYSFYKKPIKEIIPKIKEPIIKDNSIPKKPLHKEEPTYKHNFNFAKPANEYNKAIFNEFSLIDKIGKESKPPSPAIKRKNKRSALKEHKYKIKAIDSTIPNVFSKATEEKRREEFFKEIMVLTSSDPANGDAALKARFLFKSCMNYGILDKRGHQPLLDLLEMFGGWPILNSNWSSDGFDWLELMAKLRLYNNDILISEWVGPDIKNSDEFVIQFDQTGLGLPTREYFLQDSNKLYLDAYQKYLIKIAILLGGNKDYVISSAEKLIQFETNLAKITSAPEDRRNVSELYQRMPLTQLEALVPEIKWRRYLCVVMNRNVEPNETVVLFALSYIRHLVKLIEDTEPSVLANYLLWRFVRHRVNNLDDRFQAAKQQFYYILFGREQAPPRWKNCISQVNSNMGMALGSMFVKKYFDETSKNDTLTMTREIQESFKELLHTTDWIDGNTKKLAAHKVEAIMLRIGYPDFILSKEELDERYKEVIIHPDKYFENILNILQHLTKMEQSRLGQPVNKTLWNTAPAVVNAYYSRNKNQIMFPAGILQPPFYHRHFPRSLNYGGIGVVIGHEITHGFDDKGRLFDCNGNLHRWWSDTAITAFHRRAQCLIDQYGRYVVPEVNMKLDGVNTQGENIADNGGVKQAFRAYLRWVQQHGTKGETLPGLNHTHLQLFFLNFAQVWCGAMRPEAIRNKLKTAVHSPGRFRVIGTLSNSNDFAKVFQCPVGSPMNPKHKCSVW